ncbi:WXG100 family type VII secretion target [Austwickia sp. TVS 96-490-7B]|uniref:WXG100 family type VII secretion target n=1 Tax=Austwickia sp. TVS 96-490-7B TaxID=2830843 RepID=UPI001C5641F3|nr:WXG100 family type VII secretion target [Austwickia sp. TVS 96-490-7B]
MSGAMFQVNVDELARVASTLRVAAEELDREQSRLSGAVDAVAKEWSSAAATAYEKAFREWLQGATKARKALSDLSKQCEAARADYADVDARSQQGIHSAGGGLSWPTG